MERNCTLEEISDGRLYGRNDMVRVGCNDCKGCFACCCNMGKSIVLDVLDVYRLCTGLHKTFEQLLDEHIELNVADGMILPNLKMSDRDNRCTFLNDMGRCSIHSIRPGICRIFPLGRVYNEDSFQYFLQVKECRAANRTKVKVEKWIDTPDVEVNEKFINDWHFFIKDIQKRMKEYQDDNFARSINMYVLNHFYITPYAADREFYPQFYQRLSAAKELLHKFDENLK